MSGFYVHKTLIVQLTINPVCCLVIDAPEDHSRKVDGDTVILSYVQTGSSAVYQCNASNEFGYLLANAFVNVLGEFICFVVNMNIDI